MLESQIEKAAVKAAKQLGWYSFKVLPHLHKGLPDRCFLRNGEIVFIEFKRPGGKTSKLQDKLHRDFLAHGVVVHVCDSVESAVKVLEKQC